MDLNIRDIDREFKDSYNQLVNTHGGHSMVPRDELHYIGETYRAKMVGVANGGFYDARMLRIYSISPRVIRDLCGETGEIERKIKNVDKRKAMEEFVRDNIDAVITPKELAEAGDVSYATAIKFINENISTFVKVERGMYLIRDAEAERRAARSADDKPRLVTRKR